ncbi:MAG: two-component system, OmpR family, sensor histidine kinase CreC [Verrucomicrobiota bacterium]|nr:two-component system, OmpR family, sensor histidine kinase CreC [Verrucomicrobiota bacterium]
MRIRTAIFVVYVGASALGLAAMMGLVLRDVRLRYVESMRRTMGDTAAYMAAFAAPAAPEEDWTLKLATLPKQSDLLRVFACDPESRVIYDSAGRDAGQTYGWPMRGGGRWASENYEVSNVAVVDGELRVASRVLAAGKHVGWVGVGRPLAAVEDGVRQARWRLVTYIGIMAGGMLVLGWWIAARLTHSLEKLTAYARSVRDGRKANPPVSRAREIAELGRAFEEMREALEGRQNVERYTQTLAHEVKAPLAAIRGAAELLDETMPPMQRNIFLSNIRGEAARIQRIIDRLLELSSLEARKQLHQIAELPVAKLAQVAADVLRAACAARGITLKMQEIGGPVVRGEAVLLREALVNLLQNALDFSPNGGTITLGWIWESGKVEFFVEDSGPGVPDYALPRVFERFYSLPRPATERKSTGLGLALVREIAHLHGGDAALANRPEGGARATLWLPTE